MAGGLLASPVRAASFLDPAFHFRTLTTAHFSIYFHQGEDHLAARLAVIAEEEWPKVGATLGTLAPRRTHIILADQTELANGFATPLPYDTIFVTAAAPPGFDFLGRTDDWLRLVFTHEFTHIVHLDRSEGWARFVRGIFGRTSIAFPNLWLPVWQIEGLAAWQETVLTGEGRGNAQDFRAIEHEAARLGRFEPLDRVNGGLTDWPGGLTPYAYGLGFHEYLAGVYGQEKFAALAARTARSIPFLGSRAYKAVYDESLGDLWRDYTRRATAGSRLQSTDASLLINPSLSASNTSNPTRLTHDGFMVLGPRFAPPQCSGCPQTIVYSIRNPDGFPALRVMNVDGSGPRELALRYLGSTLGVSADLIVFDQQQVHRNVGIYSDLYVLDRHTGTVRQLTYNQRLQDPDLSPDGKTIVSVRQIAGRGELVVVRLKGNGTQDRLRSGVTYDVIASEVDSQFSAPRWSPDGTRIAVERHRRGGMSEIIVIEVGSRAVKVLASDEFRRFTTPAWRPDGGAIVTAVEFGSSFNLEEYPIDNPLSGGRLLTDLYGGALWPDFSPDGKFLSFVSYTPDGFDVFMQPYRPPDGSFSVTLPEPMKAHEQLPPLEAVSTDRIRPYSPWATLAPTSWFPVVETGDQVRAGVGVSGSDVLARHGYAVSATWLVNRPTGALAPSEAVPDWDVSYIYDRWRPTWFVSASRQTVFGAGPADASGRPTPATLRSQQLEGGVFLPFRRIRSARRVLFSAVRTDDRYTFTSGTSKIPRTAARFGAAAATARAYGYSISPEEGYSLGMTAELGRRSLGSSADETTLTVDGRAYLPGLASHHVVALRAAGGTSNGSAGAQRTFLLGGAAPSPDVLDFGREALSLLRGFPSQSFAGTHVALLNLDYRFPLARPQRGKGTWPLFLHTIHGSVFADAGETWSDRFLSHALKTSAGGEFSLNIVAGYSFPFTATVGAAWGHDAADRSNRATLYARVGRAF